MLWLIPAGVAVGLLWLFGGSSGSSPSSGGSDGPGMDLTAKLTAASATGESTSSLVQALEGLPPDVKGRAIEAVVKTDPALLQNSAAEIDSLGYHDLASRLRHRADVFT